MNMPSHKSDDQKRYTINISKVADHLLVTIKEKPGFPPLPKDKQPFIRPGGYCLRLEDEKKLNECMDKTGNVEALLAFIEVYEYAPPMSELESDVIAYWRHRLARKR